MTERKLSQEQLCEEGDLFPPLRRKGPEEMPQAERTLSRCKQASEDTAWSALRRDGPAPIGPEWIGVLLSGGREQRRHLSKTL